MVQPETRIYRKIKQYLQSQGGFVFKVWGSEHMMAGLPDLICCLEGRYIALEVKVPGKDATPRQKYVHSLIEDAGGVVGVVTSVSDAAHLVARARAITPRGTR